MSHETPADVLDKVLPSFPIAADRTGRESIIPTGEKHSIDEFVYGER